MDRQKQIFDLILIKYKDHKITKKDFNNRYKLTFQSNGEIGSIFNLDKKNQWDAYTEKIFTTLHKGTWQTQEQAKPKTIRITLLMRMTHFLPEDSQKM